MSPTATVDGPASWAVSGVEMALCDLAGKILDTPVYNLLGGAFRDRIRVYLDRSGVADPSDLGPMAGARGACRGRRLHRLQVRRRVDRARGQPRPVEPPDAQRPGPPDGRAPGDRPRDRRPRRRDRARRPLQLRRRDRHPPRAGAGAARPEVVRGSGADPQLRRAEARPRREPDPDLRRRDAGGGPVPRDDRPPRGRHRPSRTCCSSAASTKARRSPTTRTSTGSRWRSTTTARR